MRSILLTLITISAVCIFITSPLGRPEVLEAQILDLMSKIRNKNIAMLTNPTSVDSRMNPIFDRILELQKSYNVSIKCFFAAEHGLRGDQQAGKGDEDYVDAETNIQVYSLYGVRNAPTDAQLKGVDALVYDIQDVGARFYTYIWTLTFTIEALARNKVPLIIFDRPNPLARKIQGCPLRIEAGLIGRLLPGQLFSIPQVYGLTIAELIGYLRIYLPNIQISNVLMAKVYEIQESEWILSSPNMPTLETVMVYPGMGLLEGTSLSQGRGTTKPFQISGFPKIKANSVTSYFEANKQKIGFEGVYLVREVYFIPTFSKHTNLVCGGVEIHVQDKQKYESVKTALHVMKAYISAITDGSLTISTGIDRMFGKLGFHSTILDKQVDSILADCSTDLNYFKANHKKWWFYDQNGNPKTSRTEIPAQFSNQ